ncbi:hypothetical protein T4D_11578 [Trichinella pseudospiralis]|uniref:Uncharacterized protein n=1 Tax=Trichinella pseudospiralis TaxID=6337 RepID=A0A0V1G492_TRIPS|nr:hypothetical protein T4D_11578 [Trichinella pseudospiralis]
MFTLKKSNFNFQVQIRTLNLCLHKKQNKQLNKYHIGLRTSLDLSSIICTLVKLKRPAFKI